jgi:hypothetical protein
MDSEKLYRLVLRAAALTVAAAGAAHAFLGVASERLLDPTLPASLEGLASLDSQNRFYGAMFSVVGAVVWQAAGDLGRYRPVINTVLIGFMLAGMSRLLSVPSLGWPAPMVLALALLEVVMPPLMLVWGSRQVAPQP